MSDRQKETLALFIEQIIVNKALNPKELASRIMLAMEMVERGAA